MQQQYIAKQEDQIYVLLTPLNLPIGSTSHTSTYILACPYGDNIAIYAYKKDGFPYIVHTKMLAMYVASNW